MAEPPVEASPDTEPVAFVKKFKASLVKKWSLTKAEPLWNIGDLAIFLWALNRHREALAIARSVAVEIASPPELKGGRFNFSIWSPVTRMHALIAHLGDGKLAAQVEASKNALLKEPGFARDNPKYLADQVVEAKNVLASPVGVESQKWECLNLSRSIACMTHFCVLAAAGDSMFSPHADDAAALIPQLLLKLEQRLN